MCHGTSVAEPRKNLSADPAGGKCAVMCNGARHSQRPTPHPRGRHSVRRRAVGGSGLKCGSKTDDIAIARRIGGFGAGGGVPSMQRSGRPGKHGETSTAVAPPWGVRSCAPAMGELSKRSTIALTARGNCWYCLPQFAVEARMIRKQLRVISLTRSRCVPCSSARPTRRFQYLRPGIKVAHAWTGTGVFNSSLWGNPGKEVAC